MALLTIAIIAAGLFRNVSIPYTVLLVVIGIGLSELANVWQPLQPLHQFRLTPDLVFFIFLPALIFESGLSLDARQLLKDLAPILTLAVPALLISTTLVGFGVWLILDIDLTVALLFGALISATDPVAVVALFKELGAPLRLNVLVEGESLFNDATAIVVFGILLSMVMDGSTLTLASTGIAIIEFLRVFIGGVVVGLITGLLISELLYRLQSGLTAILAMSIVTAYASFIIAEHSLHVSGVMATVSSAMALSLYGLNRITIDVKSTLSETWELIGLVSNSLLFLLVGISVDGSDLFSNIGIILIVVMIVQLARAVSVYSLVPFTTKVFMLPKVSLAERHIMWWGGLKGGLAIAIVLSIPESLPNRDLLLNLTLGIVVFTLMVNAWSIRPLMHRLKIDRFSEDEKLELEQGLKHARESSTEMLHKYSGLGVISTQLESKLSADINMAFASITPEITSEESWREVYLAAMRVEFFTIDQLHKSGLINQYTQLDIRNTLKIDREAYSRKRLQLQVKADIPQLSIFKRIEMWVLSVLREKNWAVGLLSNYQNKRISQQFQRCIGGIVMTKAVVDMLTTAKGFDEEARKVVLSVYNRRFERWSQRLESLHQDFDEQYESIERILFSRASLVTAQICTDHDLHHGEIGIKAYSKIANLIAEKLLAQNKQEKINGTNVINFIGSLPLFKGLSDSVLRVLYSHAHIVTFLSGDIIIAEGDKGDSLYIITHGNATVSKKTELGNSQVAAKLEKGDFFGEMALMDDHIRHATVTAKTVVTLLRLTRSDVLKISKQFEEIKHRLDEARRIRSDDE